jgi:hypothetical protein
MGTFPGNHETRMRAITVFLLVGVLWHGGPVLAKNTNDDTVNPDRESEERELSRLAHVQADPANTIAEFRETEGDVPK